MPQKLKRLFPYFFVTGLLLSYSALSVLAEEALSPEKSAAIKIAEKYKSLIEKVGSAVWQYAELGLNEYRSSEFLANELEKLGFTIERGVGQMPTAFIAAYTFGSGGPVIGLLGEFDAVPEVSSVTPGAHGHGCGHNLFGSGAFGTAAVMKEVMEAFKIPGTIKFFGTPAEENYDGKAWMGRQGVFKGVDVFFGCHSSEVNTIPYWTTNAMDYKIYTFHGKSAHAAAAPHMAASALDAIEVMNIAVNFLREHVPMEARIHYVINNGGVAPNVVPATAQSLYYVRAPERSQVEDLSLKVDNCAKGAALATGTTVDIELASAVHNVLPNREGIKLAWENLKFVGPPPFTEEEQAAAKALGFPKGLSTELIPPSENLYREFGSSDEGDVSYNAPLIDFFMANIAGGTAAHSILYAKQTNMPAAHKAVVQNVKVMALTALDILTIPESLKKIKASFAETMKERKYDPGKTRMVGLKYFPEPPGVTASPPATVNFKADETIFNENPGMTIRIYLNDTNVGSSVLKGGEKTYAIAVNSPFKSGDILVVKYQNKSEPEVLYGYLKKF